MISFNASNHVSTSFLIVCRLSAWAKLHVMGSVRSFKTCLKVAGWNPASVRQAGQAQEICEEIELYSLIGLHGTRHKAKHDVTLQHRNVRTNTETILGDSGKKAFPTITVALSIFIIAATRLLQVLCRRSMQEISKATEQEQDGGPSCCAVIDLSDHMGNMGVEPKEDIDEMAGGAALPPDEEAIIEELAAFLIARKGKAET